MNEIIMNQLKILTIFAISGITISILFDIFRIRRKVWKAPNLLTYFEDILFWIISAIILLYTVMKYTTGELRIYMFVGLFIGILIYFKFFSKLVVKFFSSIIKFIITIIVRIFKIIFYPFKKTFNLFKKSWKKKNIML